jgi:nucleoside-diphosphate-sugar epimerase
MATTFITGGSGFIGRNLIRALRSRGDDVRALVRDGRAVVHHARRSRIVRCEQTHHAMLAAQRLAERRPPDDSAELGGVRSIMRERRDVGDRNRRAPFRWS